MSEFNEIKVGQVWAMSPDFDDPLRRYVIVSRGYLQHDSFLVITSNSGHKVEWLRSIILTDKLIRDV